MMVRGKVVGHSTEVAMSDCEFRVRPGGHKRVIEEKRKNVHAFVIGEVQPSLPESTGYRQVKYNPYKSDYFFFADTGEKIVNATSVILKSNRTVWAQ